MLAQGVCGWHFPWFKLLEEALKTLICCSRSITANYALLRCPKRRRLKSSGTAPTTYQFNNSSALPARFSPANNVCTLRELSLATVHVALLDNSCVKWEQKRSFYSWSTDIDLCNYILLKKRCI